MVFSSSKQRACGSMSDGGTQNVPLLPNFKQTNMSLLSLWFCFFGTSSDPNTSDGAQASDLILREVPDSPLRLAFSLFFSAGNPQQEPREVLAVKWSPFGRTKDEEKLQARPTLMLLEFFYPLAGISSWHVSPKHFPVCAASTNIHVGRKLPLRAFVLRDWFRFVVVWCLENAPLERLRKSPLFFFRLVCYSLPQSGLGSPSTSSLLSDFFFV